LQNIDNDNDKLALNAEDELHNIDVKNDNDKLTLNAEDELQNTEDIMQNIDGNMWKNVKNNDDCMQFKSK
jgi:hypothetical protein